MATSVIIVEAAKDSDLKERTKALLALNQKEEYNTQNISNTVDNIMLQLVGQDIDNGQTIADVYAYKKASVAQVITAPGADPAAITDTHILAALRGLGYVD